MLLLLQGGLVPYWTVPCQSYSVLFSEGDGYFLAEWRAGLTGFIMGDNVDDDSLYTIKEGDYVVLKRGDVFKAVQIQSKK